MGYSAAIYAIEKSKKDLTIKDFLYVEDYLGWKNNPWNFKKVDGKAPYPTFKEYRQRYSGEAYHGEPSEEDIKFYEEIRKNKKDSEYGISDELFCWGSYSMELIDEMLNATNLKTQNQTLIEINKDNIDSLIDFIMKKYERVRPSKALVKNIFVKKKNKLEITKCDGIEVELEDGTFKRIKNYDENDAEYYEDQSVYVTKDWCDDEMFEMVENMKNALIEAKLRIKYNELVYMSYGW